MPLFCDLSPFDYSQHCTRKRLQPNEHITSNFLSITLRWTSQYIIHSYNLAYPPPSNNSNIIVIILAAITGNFKYWTACNNPIACTWKGRSDGLHPILFTSSRPYLAKNRFLCSIRMEFVNSSPAYCVLPQCIYFIEMRVKNIMRILFVLSTILWS